MNNLSFTTANYIDRTGLPLDLGDFVGGNGDEIKREHPILFPLSAPPLHKNFAVRLAATNTSREVDSCTLYFEYNSDQLTDSAKQIIEKLAEDYNSNSSEFPIIIEGYCDATGSNKYNDDLGRRRATSVQGYLKEELQKRNKSIPEMRIVSFGERKVTGNNPKDRKAIMTWNQNPIDRALTVMTQERSLEAKGSQAVFLIDASGSMNPQWSFVKDYTFPTTSKLYSFNSCLGLTDHLAAQPDCGTPLYASINEVLKQLPSHAELVILSDGEDTDSLVSIQACITLAQQKQIAVSVIYVGDTNHAHEEKMKRLAESTRGAFYLTVASQRRSQAGMLGSTRNPANYGSQRIILPPDISQQSQGLLGNNRNPTLGRYGNQNITLTPPDTSTSAIKRAFRSYIPDIETAYQFICQIYPNLEGKIDVQFTISNKGTIEAVQITRSEWNNPTGGAVVEEKIHNFFLYAQVFFHLNKSVVYTHSFSFVKGNVQ